MFHVPYIKSHVFVIGMLYTYYLLISTSNLTMEKKSI
jgi:hypothetical protein